MSKPKKLCISVGDNETLEAKELLRQRLSPNGSTENLVRWAVHTNNKQTSSPEGASSAGSLNEDNKQSRYVFLWMTNDELMVCCPHLYTTDQTNGQIKQSNSDETADQNDASSDIEYLDDMRRDVIKLVNRAQKQMHRMRNLSKPLASLSQTIKVLSTYASLGSLAGVFRETGALDLILELLWTNDVDTRRAAGRMLRALALHDAGSRAYVLLSLTQDESEDPGDSHKKHYADFENRVMVMEMFAETASGEEAHAVALDSVHLPQVPGKALFTLMKYYLRVTSLMDTNNQQQTCQNKRCSWMFREDRTSDELVQQFDVAVAISDLIYELNRIMDWNNEAKNVKSSTQICAPKTTAKSPFDEFFSAMKQKRTKTDRPGETQEQTDKSVEKCKTELYSGKPLFSNHAQDSALDTSLLASLVRSDQPATAYRHPSSFPSRRQYATYVRTRIKPGYRVRACQTYHDVFEGDEGVYRQHNDSTPPVQVFWHRLNRAYWVYWHHIQLIGETQDGAGSKQYCDPPKFLTNPEESLLWPLLTGMRSRPKGIYGLRLSTDPTAEKCETENDGELNQQEWWVLLFYASKLSKKGKEAIKEIVAEQHPSFTAHMCMIQPSFDTALKIMKNILEDVSSQVKKSMKKSIFCRKLIEAIYEENKKMEEKQKDSETINDENSDKKDEQAKSEETEPTNSGSQEVPQSCVTSAEKEDEKDSDDENNDPATNRGSPEEYARAVEMGLRISLIQDDRTERIYGKMLMEEENFHIAERVWRMQQEGEKLSNISKLVKKGNKPSRIIALTVLNSIVTRTDVGIQERRGEVEEMLGDVTAAAESTDKSVVFCYVTLISSCLKDRGSPSSSRASLDSLELALAVSGHLRSLFIIISRFSKKRELVASAIHCICHIMDARNFSTNPNGNTSFTNIITAIVTSLVTSNSSPASSSTPGCSTETSDNNVLCSFLSVVEQMMKQLMTIRDKPNTSSWSDAESTREVKTLLEAIFIICMIVRKDQTKTVISEKDTIMRIVLMGSRIAAMGSVFRNLVLRLKGFVLSGAALRDVLEDDMSSEFKVPNGLEEGNIDELIIDTYDPKSTKTELSESFAECIAKIKSATPSEASKAAGDLIGEVVLPLLHSNSVTSSDCGECVSQLKAFMSELSSVAQEKNLLLLDSYWSELIAALHHVLEQCAAASEGSKSTVQEVASDAVCALLTLSELDRDFAVELCGLEAKQTIARLTEAHGSIPKATELRELVSACERQRALHSKLLAVVLGGCISTALRCVEEARRLNKTINVPLFDQLLENLCKGADVGMKEDKCYDRLEVSTNQRQVSKLTDGNPKTYWESNGSSGAHYINVFMKKGVVVRKMKVIVAQEDSSYMPARIVVLGGNTSADVSNQLSCSNVAQSDRELVVLENARRYWPVIRISIRRCQQGGIDTRIHGVYVEGPKPSFWPILKRQLYIRTSLNYSVQCQTWVAESSKNSKSTEENDLKQHKMLELSEKLIRAIRFEQDFANHFLPNAESALVLGRACRSSLSAPILNGLLDQDADSKCLLDRFLHAYLDCGASPSMSSSDRVFCSKFRHLCRLLVDLDDAGRSSSSTAAPKQAEKENFSMWNKRVHSKGSKSWNSDSSKLSTAESVVSMTGGGVGANNVKKHSSVDADGDVFEHESQLPRICACWMQVVKETFAEHLSKLLATTTDSVTSRECLQSIDSITRKFDSLHESTQELFGSRSQFGLTLGAGVWSALMALNLQDSVKFSYICCITLHRYAALESRHGGVGRTDALLLRELPTRVVRLLQIMARSDACHVFEPLYCAMLSQRLLSWDTVALESEAHMCQNLQVCFKDRRPMMMLQDISYSIHQWQRFHSYSLEKLDVASDDVTQWDNYAFLKSGGFRATLLRPSAWYLKPVRRGVVEEMLTRLDDRLSGLVSEFKRYFRWERIENLSCTFLKNDSSLHWTVEGVAIVQDTVNNIELRVSTAQMLLLLHFNDTDESDLSEWRRAFEKHEAASLEDLVSRGVIKATETGTYKVAAVIDSDVDCISDDSKKVALLWNCSETLEKHQERRRAIIDCAIVRIMKKKQECLGNLLLELVVKYCHDPERSEFAPENGTFHEPFMPQAKDVRARCEHLINTGYILHNDYTPQMLMYNPDSSNQATDDDATGADLMEVGAEVTVTSASGGTDQIGSARYFTSPTLKDAVIPLQSTEVRINSSAGPMTVDSGREKYLLSTFSDAAMCDGSPLSPLVQTPCMTKASTSTLSTDDVLKEARTTIDRISSILAVDSDAAEALLLQYDWNKDKLIESFSVDRAKTLAAVGITNDSRKKSDAANFTDSPSCPVCFNALLPSNSITPACSHTCCTSCWRTYLEMQLDQDTAASTTCPVSDCAFRATTGLFREALENDKKLLHKHEIALARSFVQADRNLTWCHNPKGCDRILRKHCDGFDSGWCSSCGWQTCFLCSYVEAHYPASCSHMSQWMDDGGYYEGMNEDAQSKHLARLIAKRCPNCQANIEKNDGCLHMKCTKCSHDFCWRCLQPWRPTHRDYYNCSSKVSKLAHAGQKFVEYNKRCQYHNRAKQFAYGIRNRVVLIDHPSIPLHQIQFSVDLCMKLAQCRKVLAYCNVFNYYTIDSEKMSSIEMHSSALENKTLELQALLSDLLLGKADIQNTVSALTASDVQKGRGLMSECDVILENILAFSKDDMKVSVPRKAGDLSLTESGALVQEEANETNVFNAHPAGMSDDDSAEHSQSDSDHDDDDDSSDAMMSMYSTSDNDDDDDDDGDSVDTEPQTHSMLFEYDDMSDFSS